MYNKKNYVEMSYKCELAHQLTLIACEYKGIKVDRRKDNELHYTDKAQKIFDEYLNLIEVILQV
jgi:hypothetical protein